MANGALGSQCGAGSKLVTGPGLLCPHVQPGGVRVPLLLAFGSHPHVLLAECHEHDARDQHPILADEGEPPLLDSEGLPVQRYVSRALRCVVPSFLISHGLLVCLLTPCSPLFPQQKWLV